MKINNTFILSRFFLLNILLLALGVLFFYINEILLGLYSVLLSGVIFLFTVFLSHLIKLKFNLILISVFFSYSFLNNGINNGIDFNEILFFLIGQFILLLSTNHLNISNSIYHLINRSMLPFLLLNIWILWNERLNLSGMAISNVWENPNSLAIAVLCPFFLQFATIEPKKSIFTSFTIFVSLILCFIIIYFTSSRSSLICLLLGILLVDKRLINKISIKKLYLLYLTPLLVPIIIFIIYLVIGDQFITDLKIYRNVWIISLQQYYDFDLSYNSDYGLNSIIFAINNYGFLYFIYFFVIGYFIYFKNTTLVTRSLILFSILHIHEIFESSLTSGSYGLIFFKAALLITHNYEQTQIKNKHNNTNF